MSETRYVGPLSDGVAGNEAKLLSHCHRCGACICNWHTAYADDTFDEARRLCESCLAAPRAEGLDVRDEAERVVSNLLAWADRYRNADPTLHPEEWYIVRDDGKRFLADLDSLRSPESDEAR